MLAALVLAAFVFLYPQVRDRLPETLRYERSSAAQSSSQLSPSEFDQIDSNDDAARLAAMVDQLDDLISDEDVEELAAGLEPNSSAAILVFEHTWAKPLRDAIVASGGILAANFRVPGLVVEEVLAELQATS